MKCFHSGIFCSDICVYFFTNLLHTLIFQVFNLILTTLTLCVCSMEVNGSSLQMDVFMTGLFIFLWWNRSLVFFERNTKTVAKVIVGCNIIRRQTGFSTNTNIASGQATKLNQKSYSPSCREILQSQRVIIGSNSHRNQVKFIWPQTNWPNTSFGDFYYFF